MALFESARDVVESVEARARERVRGKKWAVSFTYGTAIVLFPLVESVLMANFTSLTTALSFWGTVGILTLVVLSHFATGLLAYSLSTADDFFFEFRDLAKKNSGVTNDLNRTQNELAQEKGRARVLRLMLLALSRFSAMDRTDPSAFGPDSAISEVRKLMLPLIQKREDAIGYKGAYHNIAIYLYSDEARVLRKFYREAHADIPQRNRDLLPSQGHVGLCYSRKKPIFSPDTMDADVLRLDDETESTPYRSIAVAPIFYVDKKGGTDTVRGVFVITSSKEEQIDKESHGELVLSTARIISLFLYEADQHIQPGQSYV